MNRRFALAPMSGVIYALTVVFVPWPLISLAAAFLLPDPGARMTFLGLAIFLALVWASVWFYWRPSAFELGPSGLTVEFPLRTLRVERGELAHAFAR